MSKKLYSIPLAGLALSSIGCGAVCGNGVIEEGEECDGGADCDAACQLIVVDDAIVDTFVFNAINNYAVPYTAVAADINGDGTLICDQTYAVTDVTFVAALTGSFTYSTTYANCVDAAGAAATPPTDIIVNYDATVTIVAANTTYTIALAGGAVATLDCDLANGVLDCTDENGAVWALTAQ